MANWTRACATDDIEIEDLIRFDHQGRTFVIIRSPDDSYFAMAASAATNTCICAMGW
jgi:3-phenylpropionate/trans-cinnamate dioxygenase ferredoxin component